MIVTAEQIKALREKTGAGISDVKKALEECGGDIEKAVSWLERKLGSFAVKKSGRDIKAGLVESYVHSNDRIGSLVEIGCETDFVARNPQFKAFAHDIAMHIAAMNPIYLSFDFIPKEVWDAEKSSFEEKVRGTGKPEHILGEIIDGKLKAHFGPMCLLSQQFIKDQDKTIADLINEVIGKFGENIKIGRFVRFEI